MNRDSTAGGRFRLQSLLVAAEVAAAVVLLVGTALLARSFTRLVETDKGFNAGQSLTFNLLLPDKKYGTPEKQTAFVRELLRQLSGLPGVTAAGLTHRMPLVRDSVLRLIVQGRPPVAKGDLPNTNYYAITPDYLRAFGTPVLRGRGRDEFLDHLNGRGVGARALWRPLHAQPPFARVPVVGGGVVGDALFARGLSLPCATELTDADQDRVIAAVRSFFA